MMIELYNSSIHDKIEDNVSSIVSGYMFFSLFEQRNYGDNMFKLEIDEDEYISASNFFYHDEYEKLNGILEDISEIVGCSVEMAEELLGEEISIFDPEVMEELGLSDGEEALDIEWLLQDWKAYAARLLGYNIVEVVDENVKSFIVNVESFKDRINSHEGDRI